MVRKGRVAFSALSVHERGVVMERNGARCAVEDAHPAAFRQKASANQNFSGFDLKGGFLYAIS